MSMGRIAFLVGIFGALIAGLLAGLGVFEIGTLLTTIFVVAGVIIGFMNVTKKESVAFMVAVIALAIVSAGFSLLPFIGGWIESMMQALTTVASPAAVVVAIGAIFRGAQ